MNALLLTILICCCGLVALSFAWLRTRWVSSLDPGTERMVEIADYIARGARAFLRREYRVLTIFVLCVAALLAFANWSQNGDVLSSPLVGVSFLVGALCSGSAGFIGMKVATRANVRTTNAARTGLAPALNVAFSGGLVMGLSVVGLGVLGLGLLFLAYDNLFTSWSPERVVNVIAGFSLGASSIALFARVGGGIYTKAADVGADLAGKVYEGIPEDDPRNPATIADNVGDNVGDVAGMGADLFESFVGSIIGTMVLGTGFLAAFAGMDLPAGVVSAVMLPLVLAGVGILVSVGGSYFVRVREGGNPQKALNTGEFGASIIMAGLSWFIIDWMLPGSWEAVTPIVGPAEYTSVGVYLAVLTGLVAGVLIGLVTEYYTSTATRPTLAIAEQSVTGAATNIISGLGVGMYSAGFPALILALAIIGSYHFAELYGIAIAAVGMLSVTGIQLAVDAYGPISDNAGGIAEMAKLPPEVRQRTDKLDAVGNTTAAIGKGFAIGSAALTALALFAAFMQQAGLESIDVAQPRILAGLLLGAVLPYVFSAMAMSAVGRASADMIREVGRQFTEIAGLREGTAKAEYAKCVDISTAAAIREMIAPGLMAMLVPVIIGFIDKNMLGGLLVGVTVSGVLFAIFQSNAGGAWDNAKKRIESGLQLDQRKFGAQESGQSHEIGKGSEAHKAAVVGDTVGDPFKDTSGPSLNILIKLIAVVALVIAPLL